MWPSLSRKKPAGENVRRQRATSPSEQSHSICSWPRNAASTAPEQARQQQRRAAAAAPVTIMITVTAFADSDVASSALVR